MIVDDLKNSILQKAFEGKITFRNNSDTSVDISLRIIKIQKQILMNKYKSNREPIYNHPLNNEYLFEIPKEWKWVRIGELGVFKKGPFGSALTKNIFVKKNDDTIKVYEQQNVIKKDVTLGNYYITKDYYEKYMKSFEVNLGDILVSCAGTIGETFIIPQEFEKGIINQALMKMTMVQELNIKYFLLYFDYILKKTSNNLSSGSAIKNIPPFEVFKQLMIPLPPIEEQQRIVDKIEELFQKLSIIKPIEENIDNLKKQFPNEMYQSIIFAALTGKLSFQNNNESSQAIIENIKKNTKVSPKIIVDNTPFNVPSNWTWIKFGDLVDFNIGKTPPRSDDTYWADYEYNWISISDMKDGGYISTTKEYVSQKAFDQIFKGKICKKGTLIMSFKMSVGKCSILNIDSFHHEGIISIYPKTDQQYSEVIKLYLFKILSFMTKYANSKKAIKGMTLNSKSLSELLIPLPPIEEQKRIIDKIDKLSSICEEINTIVS